jgi:hypothetical protein
MPTETAKFALEIEDGISAGATTAEEGLKSLQSRIDQDTKSLSQMTKAMRQMQAAGSVDISAFRKLKGEIDATKEGIGKARAAFVNLGGDFAKLGRKKPPKPPKVPPPKGMEDMLSAANALPGPLSKVSGSIAGVRGKASALTAGLGLTMAVVVGTIAVLVVMAAALVAVAAATAKATAALLKYAAAQADARNAERLRLQGLGTLRRWMRLTPKDAAQMTESISRVASEVPLARSEVARLGTEIHRIGVRGRAAAYGLEAVAMATAVQGELGGRRMMMLVRMAGHSEDAMRDLANRVRKELGSTAAGQMRLLGMLSTKLRESFQELFTGVDVAPLTDGLYRLAQLLSQNTESGRALRGIISAMLAPFIDELGGATAGVEYFFKELVILALRGAIAFLQVRNSLRETFGSNFFGRMIQTQEAMHAFRILAIAVGIAIAVLAAGVGVLVVLVLGLISPFLIVAAAMYAVYHAGQFIIEQFGRLQALFESGKWRQAGTSIITGLVSGLLSGAHLVRTTVRGIANAALGEFRGVLGISSPSTVFARAGVAIPQGVAQGIEQGAPEAQGAATHMVQSTTTGAVNSSVSNARSVQTGDINIQMPEGADRDTAASVVDALSDFFENGLATEPV